MDAAKATGATYLEEGQKVAGNTVDRAKETKDTATTQGQQHVEAAEATGVGIYEQVKQMAGSAVAVAQVRPWM